MTPFRLFATLALCLGIASSASAASVSAGETLRFDYALTGGPVGATYTWLGLGFRFLPPDVASGSGNFDTGDSFTVALYASDGTLLRDGLTFTAAADGIESIAGFPSLTTPTTDTAGYGLLTATAGAFDVYTASLRLRGPDGNTDGQTVALVPVAAVPLPASGWLALSPLLLLAPRRQRA